MSGENKLLLRKIELYGFKSFADKTEIEFSQGVTAIVGPNGSGKSNISDAIRWVLGEQSIRNLRGAKSEDVIFAGSSTRRSMGVAEVSVTFDNSDGSLPLDFNEVSISRRVFRSGESEYYINKSQCRLKDIHELLADTGLGRDAMTVISQNNIDEVLNSKPEERRLLFEEAAGITKYKQRKKEALRKLDETTQNLTRIADILSEIEVQLSPLAESAARTTRYNELRSELIICQVTLLANRLRKYEDLVKSAKIQQQALNDDVMNLSTQLALKDTEKEKLTLKIDRTAECLTELTEQINKIKNDLSKMDRQVAVLNERIVQGNVAKQRVAEDILQTEQKKYEVQSILADLHTALAEKRQQELAQQSELAEKIKQFEYITEKIASYQQRLDNARDKAFDQIRELVDVRNNVLAMEREIVKLNSRRESRESEVQDCSAQLNAVELQIREVKARQDDVIATFYELEKSSLQLASQKELLDKKLEEYMLKESQLLSQANELSSRLHILIGMQEEYEGFGRGPKSILKCNADWKKGICGAVTQILQVPQKYVVAIETALGGALQHIITDNEETAKAAIDFLKRNKLGRATFLPLNTVRPISVRHAEESAAKARGAVGIAANLVRCEAKYRAVIEFMLGRAIVAENIDAAYEIAKKGGFSLKIVTLEGELINPGGTMTGGSSGRREASFLSRSHEIQNIKLKIKNIETSQQDIRLAIQSIKASLAGIDNEMQNHEQLRQKREIEQVELKGLADRLQADLNRLNLEKSTASAELEEYLKEIKELTLKVAETKQQIFELETQDNERKQLIHDWQTRLKELQQQSDVLNTTLTEAKIKTATMQQEVSVLVDRMQQAADDEMATASRLLGLQKEEKEIIARISHAAQELDQLAGQKKTLVEQKNKWETEYKNTHSNRIDTLALLHSMEKELKDLRRRHNDLQSHLHEVDLLLTKYSYEFERCVEELTKYSYTIDLARSLYSPDNQHQIAEKTKMLENEISQLGVVNPGAVEEYDRLKSRYEFLNKQSNDLIEAKNYLSSVISDIDQTMSKQFGSAFTKINNYFGDIFVQLFGGGNAYLELLDPADVLHTGIDVIVQPPGKKLQNLVLLSGGERALTVIALLFAFLTYRPAPFTVVDEIDAPLDEANLQRFSSFLRKYSHETQFIVVTHRKGTMEAADTMHGVTIEEAGISRMVSVKFNEKVS